MTSQIDVIAALAPLRMPSDFAAISWQDCLAGLSLGICVGLLLILIVRPLFYRETNRFAEIERKLADIRTLAPQERLFQQVIILNMLLPECQIEAPYREALYRPDASVDLSAMDAGILKTARTRRRRGV